MTAAQRTSDRVTYVALGLWPDGKGRASPIAGLHPTHLVNALLAALLAGEPAEVTTTLAAEVDRRGLVAEAEAEVVRRFGTPSKIAKENVPHSDTRNLKIAHSGPGRGPRIVGNRPKIEAVGGGTVRATRTGRR